MNSLIQDLRFGLRMLAKSPGFTWVAVITLGLGIGANTLIFSFVSGTLLRSFPYHHSERLMLLWSSNREHGWIQNDVSPADFGNWQSQSRSFQGLAAFDDWSANLAENGTAQVIPGLRVTANMFRVLGATPEFGRAFGPDEGRPGAPPVVILSYSLWAQHFGADPKVVGKTIRLSGEPYAVVGVMPARFEFPPDYYFTPQMWTALPFDAGTATRDYHQFTVVGRLKPGVTMQQAQSEMDTIGTRLAKEYPKTDAGWGVTLQTLRDSVTGDVRPILLVLMAAVGCVLLIACANVANLQLARAVSRRKEIAIRTAVGAGRRRIVRQFLIESGLLALAGGALGVLMASWGVSLVLKFYLADSPGFEMVRVDHRALLFTVFLSVAAALVFGFVPALMASRLDLNETLKEGGRNSGDASGSHQLRGILVTAEFALALVLLVGAGLLVRTFIALTQVNPGFDARNVLTFYLPFVGPRYDKQSTRAAFYDRLLPEIKSLPGVQEASVVNSPPLRGYNGWGFVTEEHPSPPPNEGPDASYQVIGPDYFRALRIPVIQGRAFTEADQHDSQPVAIINQDLGRTYFPGVNPVGKDLRIGGEKSAWRTVVGIVGNVHRRGLDAGFNPELYVPYTQYPWANNPQVILVRAASNPLQLVPAIRRLVAGIDSGQAISDVATMQAIVQDSLSDRSFSVALLGVLAALALILALVGIYSSMSYAVSQRIHEFGVRMALGAQGRDVLELVLRGGLTLSLMGVGIGLIAALGLTRLMSGLLFGVRASDPLTFGVAAVGLIGVGLLACYFPARRATKVDPLAALRNE